MNIWPQDGHIFFKKRRAYRRRFRLWHHIPHTVLWPACLPGNPIIPHSSGPRHAFSLRPPGGARSIRRPMPCPRPPHPSGPASFFACVHQAGGARSIRPMPCPRPPGGALRRIRPALLLSLPVFAKRAAPVPYGPCRARACHAGPPAASVRPCLSLCLRSPREQRPFHTALVSYAARACRANKGEGEGFPAPACATGGAHKTGPVCIMRYRHSALRMVI